MVLTNHHLVLIELTLATRIKHVGHTLLKRGLIVRLATSLEILRHLVHHMLTLECLLAALLDGSKFDDFHLCVIE